MEGTTGRTKDYLESNPKIHATTYSINVGIDDDELYVAIKDIKKNEELLYRYSKIEQTWT